MERAKVPQVAAPAQLPAGFIVLSGGTDFKGHQIACFPPKNLIRMHLNGVTSADLVALVEYYIAITKPEQRMSGLAFLADFRACSQSIFRVVVDALELLQQQNRGCVAVFYVLTPKGKELVKSLQKMLGLYQKKSFFGRKAADPAQARSFHSILLSSSQELYQFVSRDQLVSDFGGTLNYDHQAWMKLRTSFDEVLTQVNSITESVPEALSRLEMLKEFENPVDEEECQEMARWMQNRFQEVTAGLLLDAASQRASRLAEACRRPELNADLMPLAKNPQLTPHADKLERLVAKLDELRQLLRRKWREAEQKLICVGQLGVYRSAAEATLEGLEKAAAAAKRIRSSCAHIASQQAAEDAKERLRLQASAPAATRLAEGRELLKKVRRLAMSTDPATEPPTSGRDDSLRQRPASYAAELESRLTSCSETVRTTEDWLAGLCGFFDCCAAMMRWYSLCLEQLPVELLEHHQRMRPAQSLTLTSRWVEAVRPLLSKYPCPKPAQLDELRQAMEPVESREARREAAQLLRRVELLIRLLDKRSITVGEFRELLDWRNKSASSQGDPDLAGLDPGPGDGSFGDAQDGGDFFEAELRDLEDSISQHNAQPGASGIGGGGDTGSNLTTGSSDTRKYRKKRETKPQPHQMQQPPQQAQQQPAVREYRPRSNLGVEIDDEVRGGPHGVSLESQPKAETVWKFLENMASPHSSDSLPASYRTDERDDSLNQPTSSLEYPFGSYVKRDNPAAAAAANSTRSAAQPTSGVQPRAAGGPRSARSLGSGSHGARSLSDLVGELKELGDALFSGGGKQKQPPVSRKQQKVSKQQQQQRMRPSGDYTGSLPMRGSRSVENLFVSPEGDPMRRVATPRLLGNSNADVSATLPSRAASERLLLNENDDAIWDPPLAPEEFALLAAEPPLPSQKAAGPAGKKVKSDSGLSAVSAVDSALNNFRQDRQDRERLERDRRLQELLQEADRSLAQAEDNQSDSGLSDHTMPRSVIDFRSRAAWGKTKPTMQQPAPNPATHSSATAAAPPTRNQDSGRPSSETDDVDQIINDIQDITTGRYPRQEQQHPLNSHHPHPSNQLLAPPRRGRAYSDYEYDSNDLATEQQLRPPQQKEQPQQQSRQQHPQRPPSQQSSQFRRHTPSLTRMSDTDLAGGGLSGSPSPSSSLLQMRPSRHSDNFLLSGGAAASGARSHSPLLVSPPPSILEDDSDGHSGGLRRPQQRHEQRPDSSYLSVRRYNRDTPDAINPLSDGELQERYQGNGGTARHQQKQLQQPEHTGNSVFY
ncbi:hypothetical protein BOX15_Mlig008646g2 [Macrostomum lignano]|uniref:CRAL-TRIO domain-containing protein n=1 Tax=Macrostomum lignano TaxID=282301 RepID=A0A267EST7_9PLAT|nr:hypothetical protein BOX15_Mlig008646g2 [Macrostomum lignano]